ncbi:IclR family transcriptional regulator [Gordonia phthalatica]|uniref:IclR family transcriptional regulator n=2 Tax=Gordonia phthalatica TaxID=1136941 RepID=A0A0N9N5K3_9ACTN|nr:IclR family transcriptional regulator [Gordonia phthalatica]ALG86126.1 IclR family transcriptional regulator [Gordonia phthalatica]
MVARVAAVLRSFDEHHRQLPLTAISRRAGLPLSTTHRVIADLVNEGLLEHAGSEYVVGRTVWEVGLLAPVEATLRKKASPFLHDLYAATPSTIHLAVRDGTQVLYLERLRGQTSVEIVSDVGSTLPLHATGVGKVLLAHAPGDIQQQVLANLTPVTPYTITDARALDRELRQIRRDDWARTNDEMTIGASSVAVPIRRGGEVVAAVGAVLDSQSGDHGRALAALQVAARAIGRRL